VRGANGELRPSPARIDTLSLSRRTLPYVPIALFIIYPRRLRAHGCCVPMQQSIIRSRTSLSLLFALRWSLLHAKPKWLHACLCERQEGETMEPLRLSICSNTSSRVLCALLAFFIAIGKCKSQLTPPEFKAERPLMPPEK
jgi:hypothetical protein